MCRFVPSPQYTFPYMESEYIMKGPEVSETSKAAGEASIKIYQPLRSSSAKRKSYFATLS